jgi:hypothetical protein
MFASLPKITLSAAATLSSVSVCGGCVGRREAVVDLGIVPQITPATHHDTAVRIDAVIEIKT